MLGHHGAVQVEVDRVDRADLVEPAQQQGGDMLEGLLGHMRGRRGVGPGQRLAAMARLLRRLDEAGEGEVDAAHRVEQAGAGGHRREAAAVLEMLDARLGGREGIGLVLEAADCDGCHCRLFQVAGLLSTTP